MAKRRYKVRAECPACACGDVTFMGPEALRERFIGDEKEIEILCPMCGAKTKGLLEEEGRETGKKCERLKGPPEFFGGPGVRAPFRLPSS